MDVRIDADRPAEDRRDIGTSGDQSRLVKILLAVLAFIALIVGSLIAVNRWTGNESAPPTDVRQVIDDYVAAWENRDLDGLKAIVTDDFFIRDETFELGEPEDTAIWTVDSLGIVATNNKRFELVGDLASSGDGPWVVSVADRTTGPFGRTDGTSVYVIVDDAGTKKISRIFSIGVHSMFEKPNWDR